MITLAEFNAATPDEADAIIRPCLDVARWVDGVLAARPYRDLDALGEVASQTADPFTSSEVEQALSHHPRIGERAAGSNREDDLSRGEQAGLDTDADVRQRLALGNVAYEQRFDHVFLIRAAGRTSAEILTELERRMGHDDRAEATETADQLRQIAVLRLRGAVAPDDVSSDDAHPVTAPVTAAPVTAAPVKEA